MVAGNQDVFTTHAKKTIDFTRRSFTSLNYLTHTFLKP